MDTGKIAEFSDTVREKLQAEMGRRAAFFGITPEKIYPVDGEYADAIVIHGQVFDRRIKKQRERLVREIKEKGYKQVMDGVTYTWFNRFTALKFMEANDYLLVKVFSSVHEDKDEPDLLTEALEHQILNVDRQMVLDLKEKNDDEALYRYLILQLCRYLHKIMPFLFEKIEDYTELLFPERLLHTDSIIHDLNDIIEPDDWKEVEVIGWIYQFYVAKRKDRVFADLKKNIKIKKEDIPAATQLFTPKWIVKYMVENSVGRLWLESNPNPELQSRWKYFIEQEYEEPNEKVHDPEWITVLDPAMGSGHILVYAFEVLYEIYRSQGYLEREIAPLILNKNLYGLEIDDRATQLAGFAVMMKARKYDADLFRKRINLNLLSIQETPGSFPLDTNSYKEISRLWNFFIDAKIYGSVLKVEELEIGYEKLDREMELLRKDKSLESFDVMEKVKLLIEQAKVMGKKYDCVITNPPYMGSQNMGDTLNNHIESSFPNSRRDLFAVFIERNMIFTKKFKFISMITMQSWLFLKSFVKVRQEIISNYLISSMIHLGPHAFEEIGGEVVSTTAFVLFKGKMDLMRPFIRLTQYNNSKDKKEEFFNPNNRHHIKQQVFNIIDGTPISYWITEKSLNIFRKGIPLERITKPRAGISTGHNNKMIKYWYNVNFKNIGFNKSSNNNKYKYYPHNKGGGERKWYGNTDFILQYDDIGLKYMKTRPGFRHDNEKFYFLASCSWGKISTKKLSVRYYPQGFVFDSAGLSIFLADLLLFNGIMNSKVFNYLLKYISHTLNYTVGDISRVPIINEIFEYKNPIEPFVTNNVDISKQEWDSRETSWDFTTSELLKHKTTTSIEDAYNDYCDHWREQFFQLHRNEEELNRIFIDIYDLGDELTPDVPLKDITILKDESEIIDDELVFKKEVIIKQFLSYAVGCIFGRYSPDKEGLILANQGEKPDDFTDKVSSTGFLPDAENIIPILDDEYFTDDIVTRFREFLAYTFGNEKISENLDFIADAISSGKGRKSSEEIIRDYFLKHFFKDHCKTYKKRPIYWLFTSGKKRAFNALIYMHRYDKTTLARMRHDYLHELESKFQARLDGTIK